MFGDGRGSRQPRRLNAQEMDPPVLLLLDHKVCSQLALIVDLRAIARIARVDLADVHVRNQGEGSLLELFTGCFDFVILFIRYFNRRRADQGFFSSVPGQMDSKGVGRIRNRVDQPLDDLFGRIVIIALVGNDHVSLEAAHRCDAVAIKPCCIDDHPSLHVTPGRGQGIMFVNG